ncbi:MAG: glycoside hydrolase TIM-barrel-like domain-containing protein [Brucellaceae bacterium]|nr:glycoside hydrolase TIM-barrel-like domain-containing protein [Brucellaceae bacterium]
MATILLQAVGGLIGGALGSTGAAIGTAVGALAGYAIDRALINSTRHVEGPRLSGARPYSAEEGASLPRVYGTARIGGTMIWATRFEEQSQTERQGSKGGGPRTTTYTYFANVAFALCEGEVAGVRRVWADGLELDLAAVEMRMYQGSRTQPADPLIEAKQGAGNTPAYRDTAYAVFERLPLETYGNRIPQFQFEVMRPVGGLSERVKAVTLIPGSTEYGLSPAVVTRTLSPGEVVAENRNVLHASSDIVGALDELQALCPNLEHIALVVTWFGDDLRAGSCTVRPKVTQTNPAGISQPWLVSGLYRASALAVSQHQGGAAYGGTPTDRSVMDAIAEIKARGIKVTLYPFVMMDVPAGNALTDPYTGGAGQPAYPWRGRITCSPALGVSGSADKTASARSQINAFCGSAVPAHFSAAGDTIAFSGSASDWGYRRLILHYAKLAAAAGGVDAFLLGSELRGLTALRDGAGAFPFVEQLCGLASDVRGIVGGSTKISYGADWSEYFGHQPGDGTGDAQFHLDQLWSHADIDAVGIDCYFPLADWRDEDHGAGSPDGYAGPYDIAKLREAIAAGEGYDWYYASAADRLARTRSPISDGAYGKHWVYRYKDLVNWWNNHHYDRPGGAEIGSPTGWVPRSKPIWLTELGGPAVDKGPNQPNVFPDPKSAESASPHFSNGARSDIASQSLIQAHLDRWDGTAADFDANQNPVSEVYGGRMLDASRIYLWAWDARPFPAFPLRRDLWSDGDNWLLGHWLNGRLNGVAVSDLIAAVMEDFGAGTLSAAGASGSVTGYIVSDPTTARSALEPLADLFGLSFAAGEAGLVVTSDDVRPAAVSALSELVIGDGEPVISKTRLPDHEFPSESVLVFADPMQDYQSATARRLHPDAPHDGQDYQSFPGALDPAQAESLLADRTRRKWMGREEARFALPQSLIDVGAGAVVRLEQGSAATDYLVTNCEAGLTRQISARRLRPVAPAPWRAQVVGQAKNKVPRAGPPLAVFLDLPLLPGYAEPRNALRIALRASPWIAHAAYVSPGESGFERRGLFSREATIGVLDAPLAPGFEGRFDNASIVDVTLYSGELSSTADPNLLNGANAAAVQSNSGAWEVLQFANAEEIGPSQWRLTRLLRGQRGSGAALKAGVDAGARFVLLDAAVAAAGLNSAEVGLTLNWQVGPLGSDFAGPAFANATLAGGERALTPLSPVHLDMVLNSGGDAEFTWVRRDRLAADTSWTGALPLSEDDESYLISVAAPGGSAVRTKTVTSAAWTYAAAEIVADFGSPPAEIELTVQQLSGSVGPGDPAVAVFEYP